MEISPESPAVPAAKPLRRRGEAMRRAVLDATVRLLAAEGLDGTTVAAVARAAGVHETSVYRNWGTWENLVQDALADYTGRAVPVPDTGDLRGDLRAVLRSLVDLLNRPEGVALLHLSLRPPTPAAAANRDAYWTATLTRTEEVLHRARERGELRADCDPHLAVEALYAPVLVRVLILGEPLHDGLADELADLLLRGVRTS